MFSKVYSPSQHQGCSGCVQQCWSRPAPRALRSTGCFFHSPFPFEINPATLLTTTNPVVVTVASCLL